MKSVTTVLKTSYVLQVRRKDGSWGDCGYFDDPQSVFDQIDILQQNNPKGEWQCVQLTTAARTITRKCAKCK